MMLWSKKGISPVIAVIIIIAVTIAIAVAVAGWMMGLWGAYTATETLTIMPDSSISGGTLYLHIRNGGASDAVIYKIVVGNNDTGNFTNTSVTLRVGDETTIVVSLTGSYVAGSSYTVTVYTTSGKMYQAVIIAR